MDTGVRIDDLAAPRLTDVQRGALDYGEGRRVELTVDAVLGAARAATGLEDFGPDGFEERLGLWLGEMDADPERTGLGRLMFHNDCVRAAANRLRIADLLRRHPEIAEVRLVAPVVVVGLPRTGTTHLVNLLAADTRLRSMPLWESAEPVPDPRTVPDPRSLADPRDAGPAARDARWQRSHDAWEAMRSTLPLLPAMHPMHPDHVHEELELELPDFSSYWPEWVARCPGWRDYYLARDQTPHYRYMRTVLQILQWVRPRHRWVLKSPQHLEQLRPLLEVFPDATVVVTHRDPVSVVQSAATMMAYAARLTYRSTRPDLYISYWTDRVRRLLQASLRDRPVVPAHRCIDVVFGDFMRDEMGTVGRIYEAAGLTLDDEARRAVATYAATHPRGAQGQVAYDLRADFDVAPADVRAEFEFYLERFALPVEVH